MSKPPPGKTTSTSTKEKVTVDEQKPLPNSENIPPHLRVTAEAKAKEASTAEMFVRPKKSGPIVIKAPPAEPLS